MNSDEYEVKDTDKKFSWLLIRTIAAFLSSIPFVLVILGIPISLGLQATLATLVQFFCAWPFYLGAWKGIKRLSTNMDTLIVFGTSAAYLFSFYAIWAEPKRGIYFEISSVLITCILLGRLVEERSHYRIESGMRALISRLPKIAHVRRGLEFIEVPIEEVRVGNQFFVRPGERIPVDGEVLEGASIVDESILSGENISEEKQKGDLIFAGTMNLHGNLTAIAQRIGEETTLEQMIQLAKQARNSKAPIEKFAIKVFDFFTPAVLIIAMLTWIGWWLFASNFNEGLTNAIAVLVIACPCALGFATSIVVKVACARATKMGIIIKNAETIEKVQKINRLIIDKTNIVTEGKLRVEKAQLDNEYYPIVKNLSEHSEHPSSKGILEYLKNKSPIQLRMLAIRSTPGKGVSGYFDQRNYYSGSLSFLEEHGIKGEMFTEAQAKETGMIVGVGTEKLALGYFVLSEQILPESKEAIHSLKKMGIETILITSDRLAIAEKVAQALGFDHYEAQVPPNEKARYVEHAKQNGKVVGMVGEGLNDVSALAAADISFAVGSGRELSLEAASVGLMNPHIKNVVQTIVLSKQAYKKIKQNLFFAFAYNILGIPLAAFGFFNPMIAGAAMALSSVSIVFNALHLQRKKLK